MHTKREMDRRTNEAIEERERKQRDGWMDGWIGTAATDKSERREEMGDGWEEEKRGWDGCSQNEVKRWKQRLQHFGRWSNKEWR